MKINFFFFPVEAFVAPPITAEATPGAVLTQSGQSNPVEAIMSRDLAYSPTRSVPASPGFVQCSPPASPLKEQPTVFYPASGTGAEEGDPSQYYYSEEGPNLVSKKRQMAKLNEQPGSQVDKLNEQLAAQGYGQKE